MFLSLIYDCIVAVTLPEICQLGPYNIQIHIQCHVTTIRRISTCINKQKCVQLVAVSKGSLATYFDFLEGKNEAYSIHFVSLELIFTPGMLYTIFHKGFAPWG